MTMKSITPQQMVLPRDGFSRWRQFSPFCPISRESWRVLVRAGKEPKGIAMGSRCVMYKNEELHKFLADPLNYRAEGQS